MYHVPTENGESGYNNSLVRKHKIIFIDYLCETIISLIIIVKVFYDND